MNKKTWILNQAGCDEIGMWDGFDDALIGVATRCGMPALAVYDRNKMISILKRDMTEDDANEHLEFNIAGAYVGALTPLIMAVMPKKKSKVPADLKLLSDEIEHLRFALTQIAAMKDEPYSAEFAQDILNRRLL